MVGLFGLKAAMERHCDDGGLDYDPDYWACKYPDCMLRCKNIDLHFSCHNVGQLLVDI